MDDLIRWSVTTPGITTIFIIALAIALLSLIPNQQGRKEIAWIIRFLAVFIGIYHDITYAENDNRFARTTHRNDNRVADNLQ